MNSDITIRLLDTETEQPAALPLLARCFPDYWEQTAARNKVFPFDEISFGAFLGEEIVGHCGIIPYTISDGAGRTFLFGGIASVAVAPEARGQGIARNLCLFAKDWAAENGYDSLPLYTGKDRVYESAGWYGYTSTQPRQIVFPSEYLQNTSPKLCGSELPENARALFIDLYEKQDFCGKVLRGMNREYLGWRRIFQDPAHRFAYGDGITAIFFDDTLAECFADNSVPDKDICRFLAQYAVNGELTCALHDTSPIWNALANCGCKSLPCIKDIMHGEHQMTLDIAPSMPHRGRLIHYSLVDKF